MTRSDAISYVSYIVDNALNGRRIDDDPHANVTSDCVLVGWQCGFEPLFVAVKNYLGGRVAEDEACEIATDYLAEIGWFSDEPTEPDFVF